MVREADVAQKPLADITGSEDFLSTWLPLMVNYLTVTLKAPWALFDAYGWWYNDDHRNECDESKQKARQLDRLVAIEVESLTTERFLDRRATMGGLPVTPQRDAEDGEDAQALPPAPAGKVTAFPAGVYTFSKVQSLIHDQCQASTAKHLPGLLSDVDVNSATFGTDALRMLFDVIAPRDDVNKSAAKSKFEAYFEKLRSGVLLYPFFEGALRQSRVHCYYEQKEHESHAIVDRTITAMFGHHDDGLLLSRLDRFKDKFSTLLAAARELPDELATVRKNKVAAFRALLLQYDQDVASKHQTVLATRTTNGGAGQVRRQIMPHTGDPRAAHWSIKAVSTPDGVGPCTWCLTFLGKEYAHDVSVCRNKSNPAKLKLVAEARERGALQADDTKAKKVETCIICNGAHRPDKCEFLTGVRDIVKAHQAKIEEDAKQLGRVDANTSTSSGKPHELLATMMQFDPTTVVRALSTPPSRSYATDYMLVARQATPKDGNTATTSPDVYVASKKVPPGYKIVPPGSEGFRVPRRVFSDHSEDAIEQRRLAKLSTRVRHDVCAAFRTLEAVAQFSALATTKCETKGTYPVEFFGTQHTGPPEWSLGAHKKKRKRLRKRQPAVAPSPPTSPRRRRKTMTIEEIEEHGDVIDLLLRDASVSPINIERYSMPGFDSHHYSLPARKPAQLDSGATRVVTNDPSLVSDPTPCLTTIRLADGKALHGQALCGLLNAHTHGIPWPRVPTIVHPKLEGTLLSQPQLVSSGGLDFVHSSHFGCFAQPRTGQCPICVPHPERISMHATDTSVTVPLEPITQARDVKVCNMDAELVSPRDLFSVGPSKSTVLTPPSQKVDVSSQTLSGPTADQKLMSLWHARLNCGQAQLQLLARQYPETFTFSPTTKLPPCHCCHRSLARKADAPPSVTRGVEPLEEIHMDLFFPGKDIVLFLCDRASKFEWVYLLNAKSDIPFAIQQWLLDVNTSAFNVGTIFTRDKLTASDISAHLRRLNLPQRVKVLYADNAREHMSSDFCSFLEDLMIQQRFTVVENQRQNALAEHNGGWRLMSQLRHDMDLSNLSPFFRRHALHLNVERRVCTPRVSLGGQSPFNILYPRKTPPFKYFKTFGSSGSLLRSEKTRQDKCIPRAEPVIYIGTGLRFRKSGYLVFVPRLRTAVVAEHVHFDEHDFPARKQRHVEDFTTALPGDIDPTAFDILPAPAVVPTTVSEPHAYPTSPLSEPTGAAMPDSGIPPALVAPLPDLLDSDDDDDVDAPDISETIRRDVLRTLERRRHASRTHPLPPEGGGENTRLLDLYGTGEHVPNEHKETHDEHNGDKEAQEAYDEHNGDKEAQMLYDDIPPEPLTKDETEILDEIETVASPQPPTLRRSARLHRIQTRHAHDNSPRALKHQAPNTTGVANFDMLSSDTTKFGLDVMSGELIDAKGYLSAGVDDFNQGRLEDKYIARVLVKALKACAKEHPTNRAQMATKIRALRNPKSVTEALRSSEYREWIDAIHRELGSLIEKGVFEVRDKPVNRKVIPTKIVLKIKLNSDGTIDKMKARCCVLGFRQKSGLDYNPDQVYSPMTESSTIRLLLATANRLKLRVDHLDIRVAFLNALLPEGERFYCSPPPGFNLPPGKCWYMVRALYGAHQSACLWSQTWRDWLKTQAPQFKEAGSERCVFVCRQHANGTPVNLDTLRGITLEPHEELIILVMNTDDLLILYTDSATTQVDELEKLINVSFDATPRVPVDQYLGMHVARDDDRNFLTLDLRRHTYEFIRSMGLDPLSSTSVSTPLDPSITYSKADCPDEIDVALRDRVWSAHGKLIHLAIWGRPDLAHAVSVLGRYVHNPSEKLWQGYQRVAKYLVGTRDYRLVYGTTDPLGLGAEPYCYTDSDWSADLDHRKSTGGHVVFLDGAGISWRVKLSSTVCLSTQEAEYCAQTEGVKESLNIRMLLKDLGFGLPGPTRMFCDNKGALTMSLHPANKPATRHIDMKYHFCRQHTEQGDVKPLFTATPDMVADFMTKQTHRPTHERHARRVFGLQSAPVPLAPIQHLVE